MKQLFILTALVLCLLPAQSQNNIFGVDDNLLKINESITGAVGVALVPQYAISQGMRIDLDFKIAKNQYITIGPQWYYAKDSQRYYKENVDLSGGGINLNYRYFLANNSYPSGPYMGFGLHYKYLDLSYKDTHWQEYTEYGNTYSREVYGTQKLSINQGGYDLLVGYQYAFNRFYMDFYIGWAFRLSDYDSEEYGNSWNETIFEPGYSGFLPVAGFRAGILLK